jgi:hypothetical protein
MVTCAVCSKELENNKGLSYHVSQVHGQKFCDYLVEFEHDGVWPTCACGCGEKVNFFGGKFARNVGSHGVIGTKRSEETRRKISVIQRGRKLTEVQKNKISEGVRQRLSCDPAISEKIKVALTDKKKSEEHRKNISKTRKERLSSGEIIINREKISATITQRYLDGGFEWTTGQYISPKTGKTCNYRSSWEHQLMVLLDGDSRVDTWSYEPLSIPYVLEGETRRYIPDFLVVFEGRDYLLEVKPPSLSDIPINAAKREAASAFCQKNGWKYGEWQQGFNYDELFDTYSP